MEFHTITLPSRLTILVARSLLVGLIMLNVGASDSQDKSTPESVAKLLRRLDVYFGFLRDHKYDAAYEMWSEWWSQPGEDRKNAIRSWKSLDNGIKITNWVVRRIQVAGDRAKLLVIVSGKTRQSVFKWKDFSEEQNSYWIFERGEWYSVPYPGLKWEDDDVIDVPVPDQVLEKSEPDPNR